MITVKQAEYRAYLTTPVWRDVRKRAIEHYGAICNRCGEYGNDVHHKTYDRVGGSERIDDLEIMCRDCHEAHHRVEKVTRTRKKRRKRSLHVKGVIAYLTKAQKKVLEDKHSQSIFALMNNREKGNDRARDDAMKMLNLGQIYGIPGNKRCNTLNQPLNRPLMDKINPFRIRDLRKKRKKGGN